MNSIYHCSAVLACVTQISGWRRKQGAHSHQTSLGFPANAESMAAAADPPKFCLGRGSGQSPSRAQLPRAHPAGDAALPCVTIPAQNTPGREKDALNQ